MIIKTQKEYDALPDSFEEFTINLNISLAIKQIKYIYISKEETLLGQKDVDVFFYGTWHTRCDIRNIEERLSYMKAFGYIGKIKFIGDKE